MDMCIIYSVWETEHQALTAGGKLLEEYLVACANVLPGMVSVARWQGIIEENKEVVMLLKAPQKNAQKIIEYIRAVHTYECPAVMVIPVSGGNPAFFDWIARETTAPDENLSDMLPDGVDVQIFD